MEKEDKKGLAAMIVSAQRPMGEMDEEGEEEGGREIAVQDMMEALKTNDSELFAQALEAFLDLRS